MTLDREFVAAPGPPAKVRVALVGCKGLLGDIIGRAVEQAPGLRVVADLDADADLDRDELQPQNADLVLVNNVDEAKVSGWVTRAATQTPRVLATLRDGRAMSFWELVPRRIDLGELTPQALLETIRRSGSTRRGLG